MDWIETTEQLMQDDDIQEEWQNSNFYFDAFQEWASSKYPEHYGND